MKFKDESIKVWHIEMLQPPATLAENTRNPQQRPYQLHHASMPLPELNRFLYATVGAPWVWYMRLDWTYQQWLAYLENEFVHTWVAYDGATPVGYFELELQPLESVEIAYFGLIPEFIGKGYGKSLLEDAISKAWQLGGKRVWLHTCSLDHPHALNNYLARGFTLFKEEEFVDQIPVEALQPWAGANKPAQN